MFGSFRFGSGHRHHEGEAAKLAVPRPFDIYASQEASESASVSGECSAIALASREDMIPPYVAITIDAEGNYAVGVARPTEDSYVVDVEKIPSTESFRLREEVALGTDGNNPIIYIVADGRSQTHSFVAVLAALAELELCNLSIVVNRTGNQGARMAASGRKRPLLSVILGGIYDRFTSKAAVFSNSFGLTITIDKGDYR